MADIISQYSNYEIFVLKAENTYSLELQTEPEGWKDSDPQLDRNADYHGIFTSFTSSLIFRGEAADYIENAYSIGGINTNLRLIRYKLKDIDGDVKYVEVDSSLADFKTKQKKDGGLSIKFNSNELEDIIKSHQSDDFELERLTSIDDKEISAFNLFKTHLSGRNITGIGETNVNENVYSEYRPEFNKTYQLIHLMSPNYNTELRAGTIVTKYISEGDYRFSTVDSQPVDDPTSSNMFYVRTDVVGETANVKVSYDINMVMIGYEDGIIQARLLVKEWNGSFFSTANEFNLNSSTDLNFSNNRTKEVQFKGDIEIDTLLYNQGLMIEYTLVRSGHPFRRVKLLFDKHIVKVISSTFQEDSTNLSVSFVHDVVSRLMYILTGDKERFYSKYFGRKELGYKQDGEGGLIGMISGFWIRQFDSSSDRYKSMQISLKDIISSTQAVFNVGVGIETFNNKQRLRFENLKYFYQPTVTIRLPNQVANVVRTLDSNLFFSGTELGYEYGGDYEDTVGLDEPNTVTKTVTPIRKSDKKYVFKSKVRSDGTGLELTRRKPQLLFPEEDTSQDEHNWFLDLKRDTLGFREKLWPDRLQEEPTGINSPESYSGMFFTPLSMLFRHGFVIRAGLEHYYDKLIKYASSSSNSKLKTFFTGKQKSYYENSDILVSELDRPRFLPDIIEFEHAVDDDLMDIIMGKTRTLVEGQYEEVLNFYFKIEFLNEDEELETGYLLNLKPKDGKFTVQKANDNLIKR